MILRIRYQMRGEWTCVDVYRIDDESPERARGHVLFKTAEWTLLYRKLGQTAPIGNGGIFELDTQQ